MSDTPDDHDLLAASYALAVLDRAEAAEVEAAMATDPALRLAIAAWDDRLAPLAEIVPPVPPPLELWSRIVASAGLGVVVPPRGTLLQRAWHSTPFWRVTTAGALAIAAAVAAVAFLRAPSPAERLVAALAPPGAPAAMFMAEVQPDGRVLIRALGPVSVQAGKDLELWALPAGATRPVSLGVLPPIGRNLPTRELLAAQTQLLISLEPQGGSRTGQPTGPVLWGGRLSSM
jgi:anti-sigma-K factor RskA